MPPASGLLPPRSNLPDGVLKSSGNLDSDWIQTDVPRSIGAGYSIQLLKVVCPLVLSDILAVVVSLVVALQVVLLVGREVNHFLAFAPWAICVNLICLLSAGLYPGIGKLPALELRQIFQGSVTAAIVQIVGLVSISDLTSPYIWMVGLAFPFQLALLVLLRGVTKSYLRKAGAGIPFYFYGDREDALRCYRDMNRFGWTMLKPVGRFVPAGGRYGSASLCQSENDLTFELEFERRAVYSGTVEDLVPTAIAQDVFWLVAVGDDFCGLELSTSRCFPQVICIPARTRGLSVNLNCGLASGVRIQESLLLHIPQFFKRSFDIAISLFALLALSPLFLAMAVLIKLTSRGEIFFSHKRIGKGGRIFRAWKFRSMVVNANKVLEDYLRQHPELREEWKKDHKLKRDPRVTTIGWFLRKTSIDELPQLWNVFVGEMSLVGPRPIVDAEIIKYGETFRDYLRVTPGITGLWQISGRNNTTYEERLAYDSFYVRHWTPWLDLYILLRTVKTVFLCEGAY